MVSDAKLCNNVANYGTKTYALRYNRFGMKMVQMGRLTLPTTVLILLVQLKMDN